MAKKKIFYYCGRLREFWVDFSVWNSLSFSNFSFARFLFRDHYQEMFYNEIFLIILWLNLVLISYTFNDHVITFIIDYGLLMSSLPLSLSLIWKKKNSWNHLELCQLLTFSRKIDWWKSSLGFYPWDANPCILIPAFPNPFVVVSLRNPCVFQSLHFTKSWKSQMI